MRKRRTREHIVADLSVNHVERYVLQGGHVVQRSLADYGYDLYLQTFDSEGSLEPNFAVLQLKATDHLAFVANAGFVALTLDRRDLEAWLEENVAVFLVIYDACEDIAYWQHIQDYTFRQITNSNQATMTVRIPVSQVFNLSAVHSMRQIKYLWTRREQERHDSNHSSN
jgi:Domain of unknown function (DUF4365)